MKQKSGCLLFAILAVALLCIIDVVAIALLSQPVTFPSVVIQSPRSGERVGVNQNVTIQAVARDDRKIKRVELWVNDQLIDAQSTNLPGGISPFPLTVNWRPAFSGTQTIIVRAFNAQGERAHATLTALAIANTDSDNDGIADASDVCPIQRGTISARGCPDRDSDGVTDLNDACSDQAGALSAQGCPAPSANDRDGDGMLDTADACPEQPGSPFAAGCSDTDGDGIQDSADACALESGIGQNGCPTPGDADADGVADASDACPTAPGVSQLAGCSDDDGDSVVDTSDACPRDFGSAPLGGCPDRDGDSVRDVLDLCPDAQGPTSNSGCPLSGASDADNDGVSDDVDLVPDEPGSADHGGSPAPGRGVDQDNNGLADDVEPPQSALRIFDALTIPFPFLDLSGMFRRQETPKVLTAVEIQAQSFTVLQSGDLTDISCYVVLRRTRVGDTGPQFVESVIAAPSGLDLDPGAAEREWNLPEALGAQAERYFDADTDYPIEIVVECTGIAQRPGEAPEAYNLGVLHVSHPSSDWDGHVMWANSNFGEGGRGFHVEYRLCENSCGEARYQAPVISIAAEGPRVALRWNWAGDASTIHGFGVYVNGAIRHRMPPDFRAYDVTSQANPPCGETYSYYLTAYGSEGGVIRESPPSNTVTWTGVPCPRTVLVRFQTLQTAYLGRDEREYETVGPIYADFWASAIRRQELHFRASVCTELSYCSHSENMHGLRLAHNQTYQVQALFDWVTDQQMRCMGDGCPSNHYYAPGVDYVTLVVGSDDDLTIGGFVQDVDWGYDDASDWDTLFEAEDVIPSSELVPGARIVRTLSNRQMQMTVIVEVFPD